MNGDAADAEELRPVEPSSDGDAGKVANDYEVEFEGLSLSSYGQ
jgi:hypothetical protein